MDFDLRKHTHLLVVGGSRAYGMHRPTSDVDVKGVCVPPKEAFFGNLHRFEQVDKPLPLMLSFFDFPTDEDQVVRGRMRFVQEQVRDEKARKEALQEQVRLLSDGAFSLFTTEEREAVRAEKLEGTVFNLVKFIGLATEANPNILDVLFCRDEEVRVLTPLGRKLRDNRKLFLSARARFSFAGYAHAQLKRIKLHRAHLLNPPTHKPTRAEFDLPENTLIPADHLAAVRAAVQKQVDSWQFDLAGMDDTEKVRAENLIAEHLTEIRLALGYENTQDALWMAACRNIGLNDNLIYVMQKEREYESAFKRWKQFQEWETNRNKDRAALEAAHGLDTKHAAHLVRLLKMCKEILTDGECRVWRGHEGGPGDAEELLAIRNGAWTYDQIVGWAEATDAECDALYKSKKYVVPHEPDRKAIDRLCVEMVEQALSEGVV